MVPSSAASTMNREEATTMKLQPQVDEEEEEERNKQVTPPRALQWIMAASSSSPPTLTIEEVNRKSGMSPAGFWFCAVYVLLVLIGLTWSLAYELPKENDDVFRRSAVLWPSAVVAWGVYMVLVVELYFFMSVFLPRAPHALRDVVKNVGVGLVGMPLGSIVSLVACVGGHIWLCVVLASWVASSLWSSTTVIAFWVCVVRTYT
jgi:hypothetical protein